MKTIAVVGSGFAGTLAARVLHRLGYRVRLLERGRHPRFALGESSTPIAALALEALAERYGFADLRALAAYGRWRERHPEVRRGLKRGFTFYGHQPGRRFAEDPASRLLVAASPSDAISDTHWLREDVDHFLVQRAVEEGVEFQEGVDLGALQGASPASALGADFVLDASGGRGWLATALPIAAEAAPSAVASALVFGHFTGLKPFVEVAAGEGVELPAGPYPDHWAAVHHLLDVGWMYVLPFDHGVTSAGFLLDHTHPAAAGLLAEGLPPDVLWQRLLARFPSVGTQFAAAQPTRPIGFVPRIQHRLRRAAGEGWLLLPSTYAFTDPLFSTGIAWSLAGVERIGRMFAQGLPSPEDLARYAGLLAREADQIDGLVAGAYAARHRFRLAAAYAMLYFAAVSYGEALRRLRPEAHDWAWRGFLGSEDEVIAGFFPAARARLAALGPAPDEAGVAGFERWVAETIAPRNVAGLADPARGNLYPVDFAPLIANAHRLGLDAQAVREAIPKLLR
jgi:tetracycline 7-halogenase / FADH2 O2-dependent halogenase